MVLLLALNDDDIMPNDNDDANVSVYTVQCGNYFKN